LSLVAAAAGGHLAVVLVVILQTQRYIQLEAFYPSPSVQAAQVNQ
jgi:hypothetical protein